MQVDAEALAVRVHARGGLGRGEDLQVVGIGLLAVAAECRAEDDNVVRSARSRAHGEDHDIGLLRLDLVDQLLRMRLGRGRGLEGKRVHQVRGVQNAPRERVADLLGLLLERRLVLAGLVRPHEAQRADGLAHDVAKDELDFVAMPAMRHLQVGLAGVDHPHVVLVAELADAPDVRGDDHVVRALRRRHVHHDHEQVGIRRDDPVDELLRIALHQELRVKRHRERGGEDRRRGREDTGPLHQNLTATVAYKSLPMGE